jgi:VWFA-related protein
MRVPTSKTLSYCALIGALVSASIGVAQDERPPLFVDRVDVNVINVEVFVTDKSGQRITGLTQDDFEITEDGKQVEITNFYSVNREDRILRDIDADVTAAQIEGRARKGPAAPQDQQLSLLVYVDNFNIRPASRKRVLRELEGFLEDRMWQGDNVMLASYFRTVDVVQPFTQDWTRISAALKKIGKAATYGPMEDSLRRQRIRMMNLAASEGDIPSAYQYLRGYVQSTKDDLRNSTRAIQRVVQSLAGVPGRKALLYVSDGLPQRPGEELYMQFQDLFGLGVRIGDEANSLSIDPLLETMREDQSALFNRIARNANAHQVTLYTLDARGTLGTSSLSAASDALAAGFAGPTYLANLRNQNLQEPLVGLAEATGGSAVLNTLNFDDALADLADDFDSFYSLGYRSPQGGDGEFHAIEVDVRHPGLKVRHRKGYVDKPQNERVADRTLSSLIFEIEKNPLGVEVNFGTAEKDGRDKFLLPILVRIPFEGLTLLPNGDVDEGKVSIFLVVKDENSGISELKKIPYPIRVPRDQIEATQGREVGYRGVLKIRSGIPRVAVGVWDEFSGAESFVHMSVRVGS